MSKSEQKYVVSYGGGTNSVACLVHLKRMGITPYAIVMANPGSERAHTIHYRDVVLPPWLEANGFPQIVEINRWTEGKHVPRAWRLETLYDECWRIKALPSVAYGWKKCSDKYKGQPQRWWIARQAWAQLEWEADRKLIKVIGYDAGEERRVKRAFQNEWEDKRFVPMYPLVDADIDREGCEELIQSEGLPLPGKSACTYCPNNKLWEWEHLRDNYPEDFRLAVELSRNAEVDVPDVVGLMRCNKHGQRQLHIWAEGGYGCVRGGHEDAQPCECAL